MITARKQKQEKTKGSGKNRIAPLLLLCAAVLLCAGFLAAVPVVPCLVAEEADRPLGGKLALPIGEGETFGIRFTHSLNLSDITDTIEYDGEALVCRSTLFATYGAGVPDLPDGIGTTLVQTDEGYLLTGIDKAEREVLVMLQTVPDHRLLYRGREIRLLPLYGSGALVRLCVRRAPLLAVWLSR